MATETEHDDTNMRIMLTELLDTVEAALPLLNEESRKDTRTLLLALAEDIEPSDHGVGEQLRTVAADEIRRFANPKTRPSVLEIAEALAERRMLLAMAGAMNSRERTERSDG
jgi:hypothetical protein